MISQFDNIVVRGISSVVPSIVEENANAAPYLGERRCKKQIKLTGIERRHVSMLDQKMSDLCFVAAKQMMDSLGWVPEDVKVLVLLTQNPNYIAPSTAFLLQKILHIPNDCVVFDANLGCSSFNVGLQIVASLLQQFTGEAKGLCLQGDMAYEVIHPGVSPDDMAGAMLFGAAGSATAIEKKADAAPIPFATFSDGRRYQAILRKPGDSLCMDGEGVFNFSTNDVAEAVLDFRKHFAIEEAAIDFYVFHQAQKLILDSIAAACHIPDHKELRSLRDYGNTSGASVPLSICANREVFADRKEAKFFTCGFGVGLSWSMAYIPLDVDGILPVQISDEIFEG